MKTKDHKIAKAMSQLRAWFLAESWPFEVLHVDLSRLDHDFSLSKKSLFLSNDMRMVLLVCERFFFRDKNTPTVRNIFRTLGLRCNKPLNPVIRLFMHLAFVLKDSSTVILHNVETLEDIACVAGSQRQVWNATITKAAAKAFPGIKLAAKCIACEMSNPLTCIDDLLTCSTCGICFSACSEFSDIMLIGIKPTPDVENEHCIQRDIIERRLRMEARDDDERLVARLVQERRRSMNVESRRSTPTSPHVPKPSREKSCKALEISDAATRVRKQVVKEASQEAQRKHECDLREKEADRVAHLEELLRIRRIGEEIGKGR